MYIPREKCNFLKIKNDVLLGSLNRFWRTFSEYCSQNAFYDVLLCPYFLAFRMESKIRNDGVTGSNPVCGTV